MEKIIVVGNGMVGYKFCEKLMSNQHRGNYEVLVFGEEPRSAYDRVHLSEYFSNESPDDLLLAPLSWYKENNIELRTSELISEIKPDEKSYYL